MDADPFARLLRFGRFGQANLEYAVFEGRVDLILNHFGRQGNGPVKGA